MNPVITRYFLSVGRPDEVVEVVAETDVADITEGPHEGNNYRGDAFRQYAPGPTRWTLVYGSGHRVEVDEAMALAAFRLSKES